MCRLEEQRTRDSLLELGVLGVGPGEVLEEMSQEMEAQDLH